MILKPGGLFSAENERRIFTLIQAICFMYYQCTHDSVSRDVDKHAIIHNKEKEKYKIVLSVYWLKSSQLRKSFGVILPEFF